MERVIQVTNLVKQYGSLTAVNGISFDVYKGEIFGLLGENGAGKTTVLEIIEGLRKQTEGTVQVLGHDAQHESASIKQKIGVQLQASSYYQYLTLEEILRLFGSFYGLSVNTSELLALVNLESKAKSYVSKLSGGQKQRFSIVASLVNNPEIVFLDEPTTGLDPIARRNLWKIISHIREQGKTVVLTTHYMEEAELLCDRLAIMDKGTIVALDKTSKLVNRAKAPYVITFEPTKHESDVTEKLSKFGTVELMPGKAKQYKVSLKSSSELRDAISLVQSFEPDGLAVRPASLEDLFVELTGKTIPTEEHHAD